MAQTIQSRSLVQILEKKENTTLSCSEAVNEAITNVNYNLRLLLSLYDSLQDLTTKLDRLDDVIKRKNLEININRKDGEKRNETQI